MNKRILIFLATFALGEAREATVGPQKVILPTPLAMRDFTDEDIPSVRVLKGLVGVKNRVIAVFVRPEFPAVLYPYVQICKNVDFELRDWNESKFAEFIDYVKVQTSTKGNEEKFDLLVSAWKAGADAVVKKELGTKVIIDIGRPVFLSQSEQGKRHLTLPFLMRLSFGDHDAMTDSLVVGTMTFMILRGKLVYVYYYDRFEGMASRAAVASETRAYLTVLLTQNGS